MYHWSEKVKENESHFVVSSKEEDKSYHERSLRKYNNRNKSVQEKVDELNSQMLSMSINQVKKTAISAQIESISIPSGTAEAEAIVEKVLNEDNNVNTKKKQRGRPPKNESAAKKHNSIETDNLKTPKYNLRKRK